MLSRSLTLYLLSVLCISLVPAASAASWQYWQDQATQAYQSGDHEAAESAVRKALGEAERSSNPASYTASSLNMLAFIQAGRGELDAAITTMEQAVQLGEKGLPRPGEQLAALYYNRGLFLQQAERSEAALTELQRAVNDYLALGSTGNGNLWQAVRAQGQLLLDKDPQQAEQLLARALSGFEDSPGFGHQPPVAQQAQLVSLLGQVLIRLERLEAAIARLEEAVELARQVDDIELQQTGLEYLARVHESLGQSRQASEVRAQLLALTERQPASMSRVMQLNELGMHLQQQAQYASAESRFREALSILEQLDQAGGVEQALLLSNLASVKLARKEDEAALALFEQSYQLHRALSQRPLDAANTAAWLGSLYYDQRDYEKAEPVFLQALQWLESDPEASPRSLLVALQNLSALYTSWGRKSQARPYARRAKELEQALK